MTVLLTATTLKLSLPNIDPVPNGHAGLFGVERFLPHTNDFELGHVEHLLDCACVVPPLDHLERYALVDPHRVSLVHHSKLELILQLVNAQVVHLLKLLVDLFLHFFVFQKWNERVAIFS